MRGPARIVIVHDDQIVAQMLSRALGQAGYQVLAVDVRRPSTDSEAAALGCDLVVTSLNLVRTHPTAPVLHLQDLSVPDFSAPPGDGANHWRPFSVDRLLLAVRELLDRGGTGTNRRQG